MSAAHRMPSLGAGLGAALVLSACGAALLAATTPLFGTATALRAVIALLGLAYVLYAVGRSGERVGRVTTIVGWVVIASAAWLAGLPFAMGDNARVQRRHAGLYGRAYPAQPRPAKSCRGATGQGTQM